MAVLVKTTWLCCMFASQMRKCASSPEALEKQTKLLSRCDDDVETHERSVRSAHDACALHRHRAALLVTAQPRQRQWDVSPSCTSVATMDAITETACCARSCAISLARKSTSFFQFTNLYFASKRHTSDPLFEIFHLVPLSSPEALWFSVPTCPGGGAPPPTPD